MRTWKFRTHLPEEALLEEWRQFQEREPVGQKCLLSTDGNVACLEAEDTSLEEERKVAEFIRRVLSPGNRALIISSDEDGYTGGWLVCDKGVFEVVAELAVLRDGGTIPLHEFI